MDKIKKVLVKIGLILGGILTIFLVILSLTKKKTEDEINKDTSILETNKEKINDLEKENDIIKDDIKEKEAMITDLRSEDIKIDEELVVLDEKKKRLKKKKFTQEEIENKINDVEKDLFDENN